LRCSPCSHRGRTRMRTNAPLAETEANAAIPGGE
jgi:hypothetical protein